MSRPGRPATVPSAKVNVAARRATSSLNARLFDLHRTILEVSLARLDKQSPYNFVVDKSNNFPSICYAQIQATWIMFRHRPLPTITNPI